MEARSVALWPNPVRADALRQAAFGLHFILGQSRPASARSSTQTLATMSTQPTSEARYARGFEGKADEDSKGAKALELALDVRKFEIELYWKRATYFWAFTGAALAGYLTVLTGKDVENRPNALLLVSCLGLVFSVAWYFVNRASKFWQSNWEAHVDMLEDNVTGPIYKTVLNDESSFWRIESSYPFSVTKINQLLSFFVVLVFTGLLANTVYDYYELTKDWRPFPSACLGMTVIALLVLFFLGRTGVTNRSVALNRRTTSIAKYDGG